MDEDNIVGSPIETLSSDNEIPGSFAGSLFNEDDIVDSTVETSSDEEGSDSSFFGAQLLDSEDLDNNNGSEPVNPFSKFKNLFDPIYKDASITLCGAFCAIMEFKRSCCLRFKTIEKLLNLLQLLCPPDNTLPKTLNDIRKFFSAASGKVTSRKFCATCDLELQRKQKYCSVDTCHKKEPSTLVVLDSAKSLKRVLTSKDVYTVEPPSEGHFENKYSVHCRENVLFLEVSKSNYNGNSYF